MSGTFKLKRPCAKCPWRKDCLKGWLGESRADELAKDVILGDSPFWCHETTNFQDRDEFLDDEGEARYNPNGKEQFCAGALILEKKVNQGGNFAIRIGRMFDGFKYEDLKGEELVFDSVEDFIKHHTNNRF